MRYPQDIVLPALLQNLGGATQFKLPLDLDADELARVLNYLSVPGVAVVLSGQVCCLTLTEAQP
jgi:hypothetical protein